MVNHIKTLLLNRSAEQLASVGDVSFVPSDYQPITLDTTLSFVRGMVIPAGLDVISEYMIVTQLMNVLHAPDLEQFTSKFDSRVTYDQPVTRGHTVIIPYENQLLESAVTVDTLAKSDECDVVSRYLLSPSVIQPIAALPGLHEWNIRKDDNSRVNVRYGENDVSVRVVPFGGTSKTDKIPLIADYLYAYLELPSNTLTGEFEFRYSTIVPVAYNIAERVNVFRQYFARLELLERTFRPWAPYESDLSTLRDIWHAATDVTLLYGAVVLGLAYQCEGIRRLVGGAVNGQ